MTNLPCDTCADPGHCLGSWPDDDPHKPGQVRGCFREKTLTAQVPRVIGGGRTPQVPRVIKPPEEPSWEKGVAGERRPGGGFMPYLSDTGDVMGVHEHAGRKAEVDRIRERQRSDPHIFS